MTDLSSRIAASAREYGLFSAGRHLLVAVSGGADSVALLLALCGLRRQLGLRLTVAHLNHGIRGPAAEEDAAFVRRLARRLRTPCIVGRANVPRRARRTGESLEMAAREARYRFLANTARRLKADAIATAHTADDQAETVLLRLARGAGARGLAGILPSGEVCGARVVRPLLAVTRREIEEFLRGRGENWREDETNRDAAFLRNRVRHEILPLLEKRLNPRIRTALRRTAEIVGAEDAWLEQLAGDLLGQCIESGTGSALRVDALQGLPLAARRRVLRRWFIARGAPAEALDYDTVDRVDRLLTRPAGSGSAPAGEGWIVRRRYGRLTLTRHPHAPPPPHAATPPPPRPLAAVRLAVPGETCLTDRGLRVVTTLATGILRPPRSRPGDLPAAASISRAAVGRHALRVRGWRPGDRMRPLGMDGSRKLHDIFIDAKVPADERAAIPVVECRGEIVWIPGYRVAQGWAVDGPQAPAIWIAMDRA